MHEACRCFCAIAHPEDRGICDGCDVVYIERPPPNRWTRAVPACKPCRLARELVTRPRCAICGLRVAMDPYGPGWVHLSRRAHDHRSAP
jgi:hypothetical protein